MGEGKLISGKNKEGNFEVSLFHPNLYIFFPDINLPWLQCDGEFYIGAGDKQIQFETG